MAFVAPIEFVFFLIGLIGSGIHPEFTVFIGCWLILRLEFIGNKGFRIILGSICGNRGGIQTDKRGINNPFPGKKQYLEFHDTGKKVIVKVFEEAVKSPIRRQRS